MLDLHSKPLDLQTGTFVALKDFLGYQPGSLDFGVVQPD